MVGETYGAQPFLRAAEPSPVAPRSAGTRSCLGKRFGRFPGSMEFFPSTRIRGWWLRIDPRKGAAGRPSLPSGSRESRWSDEQTLQWREGPLVPRRTPSPARPRPLPVPPGPRKPGLWQFSLPRSLRGYERKVGSARLPPASPLRPCGARSPRRAGLGR